MIFRRLRCCRSFSRRLFGGAIQNTNSYEQFGIWLSEVLGWSYIWLLGIWMERVLTIKEVVECLEKLIDEHRLDIF